MVSVQEAVDSIHDKDLRHVVSLSGGKDSAALAIYLRNHYPQLRERVEYIFCDTGTELPETYEYLERLEAVLGKKIARLSALDRPNVKVKRKHNRPAFDVILKELYGGFLPSPRSRWCTRVLKIEPFEQYIGDSRAFSYIGIRADENLSG